MRGTFRGAAWFASVMLLLPAVLRAEAPDVRFLSPTGVQRGQSRTVTLEGKPGTLPVRGWVNHPEIALHPGEDGEQLTLSAGPEVPPGLYWARLFNDEGASALQPIVVGLLLEVTEEEWAEQRKDEEGPPPLPVTISGVLTRGGEVDTYAVSLKRGQTLIASIDSRRLLGSPADMVMQLVSAQGFVVAQNDDHHDIDPQIVHTAARDEELTVRLFSFPADPNSSIRFAGGETYRYRLTLTTGPFLDHVLPLAVSAEGSSEFRAFGWNLADSAPGGLVRDAAGAVLLHHPSSLLSNRIERADYPVAVEPDSGGDETPLQVPVPGAVSGRIAVPAQIDTYRFSGTKGQKLIVTVQARHFESVLDPVLQIHGPDGKLVKEEDDSRRNQPDIRLSLALPADGEYRLELRDRFDHGGAGYFYHLRVEPETPGFSLTLSQDRYTLKGGESTEIPVAVERRSDFKGPVKVEVAGLPEGVTASAVESEPEGDSAKSVKLKIEATPEARFAGPFRVLGIADGLPPTPATIDAPAAGLKLEEVWLTVIPAPAEAAAEEAEAPSENTD